MSKFFIIVWAHIIAVIALIFLGFIFIFKMLFLLCNLLIIKRRYLTKFCFIAFVEDLVNKVFES